MNNVETICPWCFEIQDTGTIRKMSRANSYMQQDEKDPDKWDECVSSAHETCKNCNQEFIWQFRTIIVAEVTKVTWHLPPSAGSIVPKVVGLMPHKLKEEDK